MPAMYLIQTSYETSAIVYKILARCKVHTDIIVSNSKFHILVSDGKDDT